MKQLFILLLLCGKLSTGAMAQSQYYTVTGALANKELASPVEGATVSLLSSVDSTLIKTDFTDSLGIFDFENILPGEYFISASAIGYVVAFGPPFKTGTQTNISLEVLKLERVIGVLQGVTIEATRPFIERKTDRTVVNVDASITNAGSTALEILEKAPGVSVDKDGNVSLKGKQGVLIIVDGRPTYLSGEELANFLRSMPSSNIDQIEIMTNPPAKFDASGNSGVINLKLKKIKKSGFNGSASASFNQSVYSGTNNSIQLNYQKNKVNLFGNYGYSNNKYQNRLNIVRKFRESESKQVESIFDQFDTSSRTSEFHNLKLGVDFYANKKTTFGLILSGYSNKGNNDKNNSTYIKSGSGNVDSLVISKFGNDRITNNFSGNLNFKHAFNSKGKEITADIDYLRYSQDAEMSLIGNYFYPDYTVKRPSSHLKGSVPAELTIYSIKSDIVFPLKNGSKLEGGIKSSYVSTDNNALYKNKVKDVFVVDNGKTNHFLYKENINAAYINYVMKINKWNFQAGLRAENTFVDGNQKGNSNQSDSTFKKNYTDFFPTVYVSYEANEKNTFSVNYGRRIDRPAYQDLNPFYYFLDEFTYSVGNTLLQPQFTNNIEVSHIYKSFLQTTLNYSNTSNVFTEVLRQLTSERKTYQTLENLATRKNLGLAVSAFIPATDFWKPNIYSSLDYVEYDGVVDGGKLNKSNVSFKGNLANKFNFKKGWSGEINGYYNSTSIEGQIVITSNVRLDAGIQKKILKDKGTLSLSARNLFGLQKMTGYIRYQDIDLDINHKNFMSGRLTFAYRFGKPVKKGQPRKTGGLADEESRIK
ncbi:MAG: TonB-dependent receptor [Ginsengibacter sp.]